MNNFGKLSMMGIGIFGKLSMMGIGIFGLRSMADDGEKFNRSATYYKIIGYGKYSYGLGLNTLTDDKKKPTCGFGDLYFNNIKDIFGYIYIGNLVCTLTIPDDAQVIKVNDRYKSDKIYINKVMEIDHDTVKYLVEHGADITAGNNSAIIYAADNGNLKTVKYLVKRGADVTANDNCAIWYAARHGHLDVVKFLAEHGADVSARKNFIVYDAICNGHIEVVKYLVERGANITDINSAIVSASEYGHLEVIKYLIEHDANINLCDGRAIIRAACNDHLEIIKYLVKHGADVTAKNNYALYCAACKGHLEVVKYLIKHGAMIEGDSMIDHARINGQSETAEYLETFKTLMNA